jgi:hypothetical protein
MKQAVLKPKTDKAQKMPVPRVKMHHAKGGPVVRIGEVATPERMRQNGGIVKDLEPESPKSRVMIMRHRARCECWLDRYRLKDKIDQSEFLAGMRFREAWLCITFGKSHGRSMVYIDPCYHQSLNPGEKRLWAERVIGDAFKILTAAQKTAVIACCGEDEALQTKDRVRTLRRGLEALSRFWKL